MTSIVRSYNEDEYVIDPVEVNLENVKNVVKYNENPNPLFILAIVVQVVLIMYLFYIIFVKRNISGVWYGKLGDYPNSLEYRICHTPITDKVIVKFVNSPLTLEGYVAGQTIVINAGAKKIVGVILGSQIIWANTNDVWNNVRLLR